MTMDNKQIGYAGEKIVALYLEKKGYTVLKRNFCVRGGEIDIIAKKDNVVAFVEVKTRMTNALVSGFEAITMRKKRLIIKTAVKYICDYEVDCQCRFDVASVELCEHKVVNFSYIENAFDATDINIIM